MVNIKESWNSLENEPAKADAFNLIYAERLLPGKNLVKARSSYLGGHAFRALARLQAARTAFLFGNSTSRIFIFALWSCDFEFPMEHCNN